MERRAQRLFDALQSSTFLTSSIPVDVASVTNHLYISIQSLDNHTGKPGDVQYNLSSAIISLREHNGWSPVTAANACATLHPLNPRLQLLVDDSGCPRWSLHERWKLCKKDFPRNIFNQFGESSTLIKVLDNYQEAERIKRRLSVVDEKTQSQVKRASEPPSL
jgi:hypothetical protein